MPKLVSIDDQRYAALTLQSLRVTIGPLQASTTSLESQESYLTAGMLPYNRNVTLQTFLSSTRDFYRLHSTFARLYNAAASPASRLRSAGSLAITPVNEGDIIYICGQQFHQFVRRNQSYGETINLYQSTSHPCVVRQWKKVVTNNSEEHTEIALVRLSKLENMLE